MHVMCMLMSSSMDSTQPTVPSPPAASTLNLAKRRNASRLRFHGQARQGKARQGKARQGKARQGKARQGKARQGKARQGKARQGKARQDLTSLLDVELKRMVLAYCCWHCARLKRCGKLSGSKCTIYQHPHEMLHQPTPLRPYLAAHPHSLAVLFALVACSRHEGHHLTN